MIIIIIADSYSLSSVQLLLGNCLKGKSISYQISTLLTKSYFINISLKRWLENEKKNYFTADGRVIILKRNACEVVGGLAWQTYFT